MNELYHIRVPTDRVVNWGMMIVLRDEAKEHLSSIAGELEDYGFWIDNPDNSQEPWGWHLCRESIAGGPDEVIGLWFRNANHATYFKLLWGGK